MKNGIPRNQETFAQAPWVLVGNWWCFHRTSEPQLEKTDFRYLSIKTKFLSRGDPVNIYLAPTVCHAPPESMLTQSFLPPPLRQAERRMRPEPQESFLLSRTWKIAGKHTAF